MYISLNWIVKLRTLWKEDLHLALLNYRSSVHWVLQIGLAEVLMGYHFQTRLYLSLSRIWCNLQITKKSVKLTKKQNLPKAKYTYGATILDRNEEARTYLIDTPRSVLKRNRKQLQQVTENTCTNWWSWNTLYSIELKLTSDSSKRNTKPCESCS